CPACGKAWIVIWDPWRPELRDTTWTSGKLDGVLYAGCCAALLVTLTARWPRAAVCDMPARSMFEVCQGFP
ncbi:MAG: hypothetical protein ACRDTT_08120, partial [Pseudonocardiaceae bacterium]